MATRRGVLAALAVLGAGGCSHNTTHSTVDAVTYLTGFSTFGREGYVWVAREKGYFRDAGIEVHIVPGAGAQTNTKALESGQAQFAVLDYGGALVRAGAGQLGTIRCVAAVNPNTIVALMALRGGPVGRPADLPGKRIAEATGAAPRVLFGAYAHAAGFDPTRVRWIETTPDQLPATLAAGQADAIGQFVVGVPAVEAAAPGRTALVLPYADYLTDLYGNVVCTTTSLLASRADLVRRFTGALMRGVRYAVDHPDEGGRILHAAVPTTSAEVAAAELRLMRAYVGTQAPGNGLGAFDRTRVAAGIATLHDASLYPAAFDPGQVVDFTVVPA